MIANKAFKKLCLTARDFRSLTGNSYFTYSFFEALWSKFRILILEVKNFKVVPRMRQEENVLLGGPKSSTASQKMP